MHDRPPTTLPEELLLLFTHPRTGVLKQPRHLNRLLGGAVLTELVLCGAITVDDTRITSVRQVPPPDPFAGRVLRRIRRSSKSSRSLEEGVRMASGEPVDQAYLKLLVDRKLVHRRTRLILRVFPSVMWTAAQTDWNAHLVSRIECAVRPGAQGAKQDPPSARDLHLAALVGAGRLGLRLRAGCTPALLGRMKELTRATPIADATRKLIRADRSS
ncbi:MAG TPA: GPP34 family phosphoprotein, partial [Streptomyces sp.]|nr:GPP34 family phosphoprotein [Streptomyces sp.]